MMPIIVAIVVLSVLGGISYRLYKDESFERDPIGRKCTGIDLMSGQPFKGRVHIVDWPNYVAYVETTRGEYIMSSIANLKPRYGLH